MSKYSSNGERVCRRCRRKTTQWLVFRGVLTCDRCRETLRDAPENKVVTEEDEEYIRQLKLQMGLRDG